VTQIEYNCTSRQRYDQNNCGQLCLQFLRLTINLKTDIALFKLSIRLNMSLIFILTGKSSVLEVSYFPIVNLNNGDYEFGLTDFETYYTISNVNSSNNKFYFHKDDKEIIILEGSYELRDIKKYLKCAILRPNNAKKKSVSQSSMKMMNTKTKYKKWLPLVIHANNNTMKSEIMSAYRINFTKSNNIGLLLGFSSSRIQEPQ